MTSSTATRLESLALAEGWTITERKPDVLRFRRYEQQVTIGFTVRGGISWLALFDNGQPVARYGLGDPHPNPSVRKAQGGGELKHNVRGKAEIAERWLKS